MLVAIAVGYACFLAAHPATWGWNTALVALLEIVLFLTSRDNLFKYTTRCAELLGGKSRR